MFFDESKSLTVHVSGELSSEDVGVLKLSALRGLFSTITDQQVKTGAPGCDRSKFNPYKKSIQGN